MQQILTFQKCDKLPADKPKAKGNTEIILNDRPLSVVENFYTSLHVTALRAQV